MRKQAREGKRLLSELNAELKLAPGVHSTRHSPILERLILPGGLGQQKPPYLDMTLSDCRQNNLP